MIEDEIKVSVLITYYNQKQYVKDSLESVLGQETEFPYEILIGDDGSEDGTYELLLDYQGKNKNISVFRMARDMAPEEKTEPIIRVSQNRLNLLKNAKGKYVTFLDGDDYYISSQKLQIQYDLLEKNTNIAACGGPVILTYEDSSKNSVYGSYFDRRVLMSADIYWVNFYFHADTFLFRNVIDKDKINKFTFDDNVITCSFLKYGEVMYVPEPMVAYRQLPDSSWGSRSEADKIMINLIQFTEGKRLLGKSFICYLRNYSELRSLYGRRNDIKISDGFDRNLLSVLLENSFVKRTISYSDMPVLHRILYEIYYYIPFHFENYLERIKRGYRNRIRY